MICQSGSTLAGFWYYTDCCGVFQSGSEEGLDVCLDTSLPYAFIYVVSGSSCSVTCNTPTPTPSVTLTPSPTVTPTVTTSPTVTPSYTASPTPTPTRTPVYVYENECNVFTVFDMDVECVTVDPSSSVSSDGVVLLKVTGGTGPYNYYWNGVLGDASKSGLPSGSYPVTVVDQYGDFTASTVCYLFGPSPSVTPSPTLTPTPTSTPTYDDLCMVISNVASTSYVTFTPSSSVNGYPSWNGSDGTSYYEIQWSSTQSKWILTSGSITLGSSNTTSIPPLSNWSSLGYPIPTTMTVTLGECTVPELVISYQKSDASCPGVNDGSITLLGTGGVYPYYFSKDGGVTYQSGNIFSNLAAGTYNMTIKDAQNTVKNVTVVIGQGNRVNYTPTITLSSSQVGNTRTVNWQIGFLNALPAGTSVTFTVRVENIHRIYEPYPSSNSRTITNTAYKNTTAVNTSTIPITGSSTRVNCAPNEVNYTAYTRDYQVTLTQNDTFSGQSITNIEWTSPVEDYITGCSSQIEMQTAIGLRSISISGNPCGFVNNATYGAQDGGTITLQIGGGQYNIT
jgi:hypothetical protein